ncbi:unnamed protein product [Vicia faba]|uniref:Transmembrane protein n=1 Tax=Vicia faba TaxID=3906 RepID=A0AAV0YY98_VICFA|nr:unnamed protein product [Vicia faba]
MTCIINMKKSQLHPPYVIKTNHTLHSSIIIVLILQVSLIFFALDSSCESYYSKCGILQEQRRITTSRFIEDRDGRREQKKKVKIKERTENTRYYLHQRYMNIPRFWSFFIRLWRVRREQSNPRGFEC